MRTLTTTVLLFLTLAATALAQQPETKPAPKPEDTEVWQPEPPVVTPGATCAAAPSDAIVLFDGKNLDEWVTAGEPTPRPSGPSTTASMKVRQRGRQHRDQAHASRTTNSTSNAAVPEDITGTSQGRGNSGVFLASTGAGDAGYELQVLDNYNNKTYVNGQAGSIYKQAIPLANASRKPGEWQTYDVAWTAPRFNPTAPSKAPPTSPSFFNGVLVQNHFELKGETALHRQAQIQTLRHRPHQTPSPRRRQPAPQLPQHLGAGNQLSHRRAAAPLLQAAKRRKIAAHGASRGLSGGEGSKPRRGGRTPPHHNSQFQRSRFSIRPLPRAAPQNPIKSCRKRKG